MTETKDVAAYLSQHPQLRDVLDALAQQVGHIFGTADLRLEIFSDPEDPGDTGKLFALIPTMLPASAAGPLLDRLDAEWWLGQPAEVRRLMSVDLHYVIKPTRSN